MNKNEVKELLRSVRRKKSLLATLRQYINEEIAIMSGVGAVVYDKTPVVASHGNSSEERVAKHIDRLASLTARYDELFDRMCEEEDELCDRMKALSPEEYEVVLNRYMRGISIEKTAKDMSYSVDGIKTIQKRVYKKMADE